MRLKRHDEPGINKNLICIESINVFLILLRFVGLHPLFGKVAVPKECTVSYNDMASAGKDFRDGAVVPFE
jgi:hypothetical protein